MSVHPCILSVRSECVAGAVRSRIREMDFIYFLPDFLMPWAPVLRGPLPPALAARSLRAFSSVVGGWNVSFVCFFVYLFIGFGVFMVV